MLNLRRVVQSGRSLRADALRCSSRSFRTSAVARNNITVSVNGVDTEVPNGFTVLQACEEAGAQIPRFCFHDRLSIAGNCRMCLVEVVKSPKPVASCAMPAMPGMVIKTETPLVKKAREGVMEFLLANHPLDCPICDQGGECDLQDQSMEFGSDRSRFLEPKRAVEDKNIGPFVKTVMTRCIHCTRCVRFADEVAGVEVLGTTGRGNQMEIGTYTPQVFDSEMSGNIIDLCPVGALTSKPYAFNARPWDLTHIESIDCFDAVGTNTRVDIKGREILRVLPRLNEDVNEEWMADKARFSYDGFKRQRLDTPLVKKDGVFAKATWGEALTAAKDKLESVKGTQIQVVAGDMVDAEALIAAKDLFNRLGCSNLGTSQDTGSVDLRGDYLFNSGIAGIEEADALLVVGSNPRMEAPVINARIRKCVTNYELQVATVGPAMRTTYDSTDLGNDTKILADIAKGTHPYAETFKNAKNPMVVVGMGALTGANGAAIASTVRSLAASVPNLVTEEWNGINVLHTAASAAAARDIGFTRGPNDPEPSKVVFLLGCDDAKTIANIPADSFVIYQGHHGDAGATRADLILPATCFTEANGTYVNTEGRVQRTNQAAQPVGSARDGWQILRALSEVMGKTLPYDTQDQVRARLVDVAPHFEHANTTQQPSYTNFTDAAPVSLGSAPIQPYFDNYFMTDPISRSSRLMAKASAELPVSRNSYV